MPETPELESNIFDIPKVSVSESGQYVMIHSTEAPPNEETTLVPIEVISPAFVPSQVQTKIYAYKVGTPDETDIELPSDQIFIIPGPLKARAVFLDLANEGNVARVRVGTTYVRPFTSELDFNWNDVWVFAEVEVNVVNTTYMDTLLMRINESLAYAKAGNQILLDAQKDPTTDADAKGFNQTEHVIVDE